LLWAEKGRAFFGEVKCEEGDTMIDCKDKFFYLGKSLKLDQVPVFVQGKKHCLHVQLNNGHGTKIDEWNYEYNADPSDPAKWAQASPPNPIFLKEAIETSDFTKSRPNAKLAPTGSGLTYVSADRDVVFGNASIWLQNVKAQGSDFSGEYRIDDGEWITFRKNTPLTIYGINFKFSSRPIRIPQDTSKEFKVKISRPTRTLTSAPWHVQLELRHMPEEGSCADSTKENIVIYQGIDQKMDIPLRVVSKSQQDARACEDTSGTRKNTQPCNCNQDEVYDGSEDCDGNEKVYCYDGTCKEHPKCKPGDIKNQVACDCIEDGLAEEECNGKYCVDGFCQEEGITVDRTPPEIKESSLQINDKYYTSSKGKILNVPAKFKVHIEVSDTQELKEVTVSAGVEGDEQVYPFPVSGKTAKVNKEVDFSSLSGEKLLIITVNDASSESGPTSITQKINIVK